MTGNVALWEDLASNGWAFWGGVRGNLDPLKWFSTGRTQGVLGQEGGWVLYWADRVGVFFQYGESHLAAGELSSREVIQQVVQRQDYMMRFPLPHSVPPLGGQPKTDDNDCHANNDNDKEDSINDRKTVSTIRTTTLMTLTILSACK